MLGEHVSNFKKFFSLEQQPECLVGLVYERIDAAFSDFGPLLLSKYIEKGHVKLGRERSRVHLFQEYGHYRAYSGFITVQIGESKANLFFLHVESRNLSMQKPLLLWFPEKPGRSSLFSQFGGNGPVGYRLGEEGRWVLFHRQPSLADFSNIIYIDQSAGCGFSTATSPKAYAKSMEDIVQGIFLFLEQFLLLFPWYRDRKFYLGGEAYGAKVAVAAAGAFHQRFHRLKLQGVIAGAGLLGPLLQLADSSEYLYQVGMLNRRGKLQFQQRFAEVRRLKKKSKLREAFKLLEKTIFAYTFSGLPTLFQDLTGYKDYDSVAQSEEPEIFKVLNQFFHADKFKRAIHVGIDAFFQQYYYDVSVNLIPDYFVDSSQTFVEVLDRYEVLAYSGQFDVTFPVANMQKFYEGLKWKGTEDYANAERNQWRKKIQGNDFLLGYITKAKGFTEAVLRRTGHRVSYDSSYLVAKLIEIFMNANVTDPNDYL
ncbi:probable serine carboxypeptidase CPVL [Ixodes scapularis]|uniref:probable serine carboxypeptidase CPVL n=1 Tax=Ixodes scapularis TaxID=6945 RepID=UPI001A9D5CDD|nr:probable serine carboxypeptidase CPVL [Ixodes scapularis]